MAVSGIVSDIWDTE